MDAPAEAVLALQLAIQTEKDGRSFYLSASRRTGDAEGRALFQRLASDEAAHQALLERQLEAVQRTGTWTALDVPRPDAALAGPIFARSLSEAELNELTSDLSALRLAYLIERDAIEFYIRAGDRTAAPEGKQMYQSLVEMEQGHFDLLQGEYRLLAEQFKRTMGFEPF